MDTAELLPPITELLPPLLPEVIEIEYLDTPTPLPRHAAALAAAVETTLSEPRVCDQSRENVWF